MNPIERIIEELTHHDHVDIVTHERPDGDAFGSALGLGLALFDAGKTVRVLISEPIPQRLSFCPGQFQIQQDLPASLASLLIVVDCDGYDRNRAVAARFPRASYDGTIINIDHHPTNDNFGDINVVEPTVSSTAQLIESLIYDGTFEVEFRTDCAQALLIGILSDTLGLMTDAVSSPTLFAVADCVEAGADLPGIQQRLYRSKPFCQLQSWGMALTDLQYIGGVCWTWLKIEDYSEFGATPFEALGVIELLGQINDAPLIAFFIQQPDGSVKLSLRSETIDVSALATSLGGGGHVRAAGANFELSEREHIHTLATRIVHEHLIPAVANYKEVAA